MRKSFKKFAIVLSICAMSFGLVACGDKKEEETTTEATTKETTEETTEATTEEETTEEETTEEVTTEATDDITVDIDENGRFTLSGVSLVIPEGFEYSEADSSENAATFVNYSTSAALVIGIEKNNSYYDENNVVEIFDEQIKVPYGDAVTYSATEYNGHAATEWVLDNADAGYVGRSLVIYDDSVLIYIEYVCYSGSIDDYTKAVETIEY